MKTKKEIEAEIERLEIELNSTKRKGLNYLTYEYTKEIEQKVKALKWVLD